MQINTQLANVFKFVFSRICNRQVADAWNEPAWPTDEPSSPSKTSASLTNISLLCQRSAILLCRRGMFVVRENPDIRFCKMLKNCWARRWRKGAFYWEFRRVWLLESPQRKKNVKTRRLYFQNRLRHSRQRALQSLLKGHYAFKLQFWLPHSENSRVLRACWHAPSEIMIKRLETSHTRRYKCILWRCQRQDRKWMRRQTLLAHRCTSSRCRCIRSEIGWN